MCGSAASLTVRAVDGKPDNFKLVRRARVQRIMDGKLIQKLDSAELKATELLYSMKLFGCGKMPWLMKDE